VVKVVLLLLMRREKFVLQLSEAFGLVVLLWLEGSFLLAEVSYDTWCCLHEQRSIIVASCIEQRFFLV
jgi:hypothetical protein